MWQQFTGVGNLAAKPECRDTQNSKVANFTVCCESGYGEHKRTEFVRCVAWAGLAGVIEQYLDKGSKVMIQGTMETRSWDDNNGQKKYTTEIRVDTMKMLDAKGSGGGQGNQNQGQNGHPSDQEMSSGMPGPGKGETGTGTDEDIPF